MNLPSASPGRTAGSILLVGVLLASALLTFPGGTGMLRPAAPVTALSTAAAGYTPPINHIVIVMQENHVYDNFFGSYCLNVGPYCTVNGTGIPPGTCVPLNPANLTQGCVQPFLASPANVTGALDLVHDWAPAHEAYDNGSMDDFYLAEGHHTSTFSYYDGSEIPTYWDLAEQYGLGDNFFASALSYSTPNHWYLVAGASPPIGINQTLARGVGKPTTLTANEKAYLSQANSTRTIENLLANTSTTWKYYDYALSTYTKAINAGGGAGAQGSAFDFWNPLAATSASYAPGMAQHFVSNNQFAIDAAAGNLPNVSWVLPTFANSDHPSASLTTGQAWVDSIVNDVESSPDWNSTALFVTWDDYGGYYDHVPPPPIDGNGVSFRAPLLVIGPYVRENYVSHHFTYFESLLHLIEWRFHLGSLTARDADAPLPLDYFDFNATPRAPMHINAPTSAVYPMPLQGVGPPAAPYALTAAPGAASVTLNWSLEPGGSAPGTYVLTYGPASNPTQTTLREDAGVTSVTISNLPSTSAYQFSLRTETGDNLSSSVNVAATPGPGTSTAPPSAPASWTSLPVLGGPSPSARSGAVFAYDAVDKADVLYGGISPTGTYLGDTWEYLGDRWVQVTNNAGPPARAYSAGAFDGTDNIVVLFGGLSSRGVLGDTWSFTGGKWTNLTALVSHGGAAVPSARYQAATTYDAKDKEVLLFGGKGAVNPTGDTWRYLKGKWTLINVKTTPGARYGASITYDGLDGYVLLVGGNTSSGKVFNDTWYLASGVWTKATLTASPGPRVGATMIYDAADQYVFLFGGSTGRQAATGTWTYASGGWKLRTVATAPSSRSFAVAAYDLLHSGVVYGFGASGSTQLSDLWEYTVPVGIGITASPTYSEAPTIATFFPTVSGGLLPYHYLWAFGDGATSTLTDASHRYTVPGSYSVVLTIQDAGGAVSYADVPVFVEGALSVTASALPATQNGTVAFDSDLGGGLASYTYGWTFGDPAGGHSSQADPTYDYTSVGTFTAVVTVTDLEGNQATASVVVPVAYTGLAVSVAANVTFGQTPLWVHLVGGATGGTAPYAYDWAFGDATPDSTLPTVDHNYSAAGVYSTRLSVTDSTGTVRNSTVSIDVEPDLDIVVAGAPLSGAAPLVVNFTSNVTGGTAPYAYQWTFGNGNTSSLPNPSVTFGQAGGYTVMLTVTDALTVSESAQLVITVSAGNGTGPHAPVASGESPLASAAALPNLSLSTARDATGPEFLLVPTRRSDRVDDGARTP